MIKAITWKVLNGAEKRMKMELVPKLQDSADHVVVCGQQAYAQSKAPAG